MCIITAVLQIEKWRDSRGDCTASEGRLKPGALGFLFHIIFAHRGRGEGLSCSGMYSLSCLSFCALWSVTTGLAGQSQGQGLAYVCGRKTPSHRPDQEQERWGQALVSLGCILTNPDGLPGISPCRDTGSRVGSFQEILGTNFKHFYIKKIVDRILGDFYFLFYISGVCFVP